MKKDQDRQSRNPILEALIQKSQLPALNDDEHEGVLYQTVLNLGRKHQQNIEARRKANVAADRAEREKEQRLQQYERKTLLKEQSIEEYRKQQQNDLSVRSKHDQAHMQDVQTKYHILKKQ